MIAASTMLVAVSAIAVQDSSSRYEVMWRLRRLESQWLESSPSARARVVPFMEDARTAWAGNKHAVCASILDHARASLVGHPPSWVESAAITLTRRLFDMEDLRANPTIVTMYPVDRGGSAEAAVLFGAIRAVGGSDHSDDEQVLWEGHAQIGSKPQEVHAYLGIDRPGDLACFVEITEDGFQRHLRQVLLSFVRRRDERLAALSKAFGALPATAPRLERETVKRLRGLLTSLANGSTEAHEYPGARLLEEAEHVVATAAKGEPWYGPERDGEFWLALPVGESSVRARVLVPKGLSKEKPAPLVIALHGRIFDGDTWFDGYGGGQAVGLARERGWMLVAPDCDGNEDAARLEAIVKALADAYPIDTRRVMLVGHSRGGGSALRAARESPTRFRAVATIGSTLPVGDAKTLSKLPLHLAAGDQDFARKDVEAFHRALLEAGSTSAVMGIHPHAEHWLAVTAALPEIFAWLDAQAK